MTARRILLALFAGIVLTLTLVGPAGASTPAGLLPDCANDPEVTAPDTGVAHNIDPGPKNPRAGDPFADDPKTTILESYGYAGLHFSSLRPDCNVTPDAMNDSGGVVTEEAANIGLGGLAAATAMVNRFMTLVYDTPYLDTLAPVLETSNKVFGMNIFLGLASIVFAGIALMTLVKSHEGNLAEAMLHSTWSIGVLLVTIVMLAWPALVAPKITEGITTSVGWTHDTVNAATNAPGRTLSESAAGGVHSAVLYQTWCTGTVGAGKSAAAKEYCPKLWKAQTISRAELEETKGDPGALNDLKEQKIEDYKDIASDLEDEYPASYDYPAGERNSERLIAVAIGWFIFALSLPFTVLAALVFAVAVLTIVAAVFIFAIVALLALYHPWRGPLIELVDHVIIACRNAVVCGAVSAVMMASFAGFFGPDSTIEPFWGAVIMAIFAYVVWKRTATFRDVFSKVPGPWKKKDTAKAAPVTNNTPASEPAGGRGPEPVGGTFEPRIPPSSVRQPPPKASPMSAPPTYASARPGRSGAHTREAAEWNPVPSQDSPVWSVARHWHLAATPHAMGAAVAKDALAARAQKAGGSLVPADLHRPRPTDRPPVRVSEPTPRSDSFTGEVVRGEVVHPVYSDSKKAATV